MTSRVCRSPVICQTNLLTTGQVTPVIKQERSTASIVDLTSTMPTIPPRFGSSQAQTQSSPRTTTQAQSIKDLEEKVEKWQKIAGNAFGLTLNAMNAHKARELKNKWDRLCSEVDTAPTAQKALPLVQEAIRIHNQALEAEKQYKEYEEEHAQFCTDTANMLCMKEYMVLEHWKTKYQGERESRRLTIEQRKKDEATKERVNKQLSTMLKRTATIMDAVSPEEANSGRGEKNGAGEQNSNGPTKKARTA